VARFTVVSSSAQAGEIISFDANPSEDPDGVLIDFDWDFGDGLIGSGKRVNHVYDLGGTYIATLTVSDGSGASDTVAHIIELTCCDINVWGESSHLVDGVQTVKSTDPVCYYSTWFTDTRKHIEEFLDSVRCLHTIEGVAIRVHREDWSEPRRVYDLDLGFVWETTWFYRTPALATGEHSVCVVWQFDEDVHEGADVYEAGTVLETTTVFRVEE